MQTRRPVRFKQFAGRGFDMPSTCFFRKFPEIPAWQRARELIPSLGNLRHASINWKVETYAYKTGSSNWKTRARDGGGTLNSFVSHSVYYIEWLLGPINRLVATLSPSPTDIRAEARVDAWLELTSGLPVSLCVAADAFLGSGHRIEIHGDNGTLALSNATSDYVNGFELLLGTRDKPQLVQQMAPQTNKEDGRVTAAGAIARRLVDSIISGHDARPGLEEGVRVQAVLSAMRLAHETGQWQIV
jgi:predicted dehydrogenase